MGADTVVGVVIVSRAVARVATTLTIVVVFVVVAVGCVGTAACWDGAGWGRSAASVVGWVVFTTVPVLGSPPLPAMTGGGCS